MLTRLWLLTFFIILSPMITCAEDNDMVLVQELFVKSGLEKQLSQIPLKINTELDMFTQQDYSDKYFAAVNDAIISSGMEAFALEKLKGPITQDLRENLTDQDIKVILTWLDSPIGKRITQLEEAGSTPEATAEKQKYASNLKSPLEETERLQILRRLDSVGQITERSAEMDMMTLTAMCMALASSLPMEQQTSFEEMLNSLTQLNSDMISSGRSRILASLQYTYKSLTDAELEKYIEFLKTPVGAKYNSATFYAIKKTSYSCITEWTNSVEKAIQKLKAEHNK